MNSVRDCPNCGSKTKLQDRQTQWNNEIRHVRTCSECQTQYVVVYGNPSIEGVEQLE